MTFRGVARGKTIELEERLPFAEGEIVSVSVEPASPKREGNAEAIRKAMRELPHVDPTAVDELERAIAEGKLPVRHDRLFDES
jgi:hypothetical protein